MFFVYILRTSANTLYIGQTNNLEKRMEQHRKGKSASAKYMRYVSSFKLEYTEKYKTRKAAMHRERELKLWPRVKKEELIKSLL